MTILGQVSWARGLNTKPLYSLNLLKNFSGGSPPIASNLTSFCLHQSAVSFSALIQLPPPKIAYVFEPLLLPPLDNVLKSILPVIENVKAWIEENDKIDEDDIVFIISRLAFSGLGKEKRIAAMVDIMVKSTR